MITVISIAGAAALAVIADGHIRSRSPEAAASGLRALREFAAMVLVAVKAVEGVSDILAGRQRLSASTASPGLNYRDYDDAPAGDVAAGIEPITAE